MPNCKKCGAELTDKNWQPCFRKRKVRRCKECHNKLVAAWAEVHPDNARKRSARWRERNPEHASQYYRENKELHGERARRRLFKLKTGAINLLGGKCVGIGCGITDIRVLQINHLNGGGTRESLYGQEMYQAIINGTRSIDDLDVRCANCNIIYEYESGRRKLPTE